MPPAGGTLARVQDFLVIDNVSKSFGSLRAVDGVSLRIGQGEVFSLLGPSGCGKTTLLRMLAGFDQPDSGRILLNGQDITVLPPERRPVNTVFQNYALFPHLSVWDNIAFGLRMARKANAEIQAAVERMLELVRLKEHASKRPAQLSGGQRQRVAIARALVNEPQVLLLDEPLAALDLKLRQHMLSELKALHEQVGATFVYVTHDQGEAMSLSDRIAVLHAGWVEQVAKPSVLYEHPATQFVASFIGDANFLDGVLRDRLPLGRVLVSVEGFGHVTVTDPGAPGIGSEVRIMIRPERLMIHEQPPVPAPGLNIFPVHVEEVKYFGSHTRLRARSGGHALDVECLCNRQPAVGGAQWITFDCQDARLVEKCVS